MTNSAIDIKGQIKKIKEEVKDLRGKKQEQVKHLEDIQSRITDKEQRLQIMERFSAIIEDIGVYNAGVQSDPLHSYRTMKTGQKILKFLTDNDKDRQGMHFLKILKFFNSIGLKNEKGESYSSKNIRDAAYKLKKKGEIDMDDGKYYLI